MNLLERYVFRIALGAFLACLLGLTAVIWVTQALRELDLLTGKGQTILVFLTVTGLTLPALITVIAPVALFIATLYTLNKLNGDSELIVMSAAGMAPRSVMRPFMGLATLVVALTALMTLYLMPTSFQELRGLVTKIRADFVANLVREGQFTTLDQGVTFHYRERAGGALLGIFMQDKREAGRTVVYLAERGQTFELNGESFLVLEKGSIHRQQAAARDTSIVAFERYALDLSALTPEGGDVIYKPRERSTMQLVFMDPSDWLYQNAYGRVRAEIHDRLSAALYPLAMVLIAVAALGDPRTTRQGRGLAIVSAIVAVGAMRIAGFAATSAVVRTPWALVAVYGVPLAGAGLSLLVILGGARVRAAQDRLARLFGPVTLPRLPRLRRA
ncbi:LPS export ABC transporter permease LptF [Salinarimonas soli]|uniref:LPS export ABC transporter permease LptF n=1 Tax=Salinarimonas soli TaxID=1638099 RepID=A0A5B2V795_9HYPH|nr:LPS export ABC transporter permease LptF [Salinarimonas soli]KAA2234390.1 LPS export ABC transporter permease LptF [Salinarimonas soli]